MQSGAHPGDMVINNWLVRGLDGVECKDVRHELDRERRSRRRANNPISYEELRREVPKTFREYHQSEALLHVKTQSLLQQQSMNQQAPNFHHRSNHHYNYSSARGSYRGRGRGFYRGFRRGRSRGRGRCGFSNHRAGRRGRFRGRRGGFVPRGRGRWSGSPSYGNPLYRKRERDLSCTLCHACNECGHLSYNCPNAP
mmetsp:Transcript_13439/g.20133  ORF Transcript_13439/g.20133 Transcript_13439/m.20133 type:complete len:197 (+) Transcript_13439:173-763(+)